MAYAATGRKAEMLSGSGLSDDGVPNCESGHANIWRCCPSSALSGQASAGNKALTFVHAA